MSNIQYKQDNVKDSNFIRIMSKGKAVVSYIEGLSGKSNKVFEFRLITPYLSVNNINDYRLTWNVWETKEDGIYCLTYVDDIDRRHVIYYHVNSGDMRELSLQETLDLCNEGKANRHLRASIKRKDKRRQARRVKRQLKNLSDTEVLE